MMEKQTTCKLCKNLLAAVTMMLCFMSAAFAQNLQTTLGESWTGSDWENSYLSSNTYDGNDYLIGTLSQLWTTPPGQWDNAARYTYLNNGTGAATQTLMEVWDDDANEWMMSQRVTNTLNGSDQVLTSITEIWTGTQWYNLTRQTHTYGGGFVTSTLMETWDFLASTWNNNALTTYTNNPNGSVNQAVNQVWNPGGSVWVNSSRSTYTYNGASQVITELGEIWTAGAWQNESRNTNTYSGGWLSYSLSEVWSVPNSAWQNESQSFYTNNANGTVAQIVVQNWDFGVDTLAFGDAGWVNAVRITFTYEGLGLDEKTKSRVVIYPNPANDFFTVKSDAVNFNTYSITDQHGRTVQKGNLPDNETSVDIRGLSSGIYFLQFDDSQKSAIKFIKQ